MSQIEFVTFGCKVNTYDTGLLQKRFNENKVVSTNETPVLIVNTCAVTEEATREAIRAIRRWRRENPHRKIVVTGCGAQVDTEPFAQMTEVDLVVANSHKSQLPNLIQNLGDGPAAERVYKANIFKKEDLEAGGGEETHHTRSYLKIQDGCNSFCTFCVIPFARGKSRSIPADDLVQRIQELHEQGVKEIVLTGVHIGDYVDEQSGRGLSYLVEQILKRTRLQRIRLSSLEPIELDESLLELYSDSRLCPHFHISLQSANTRVLSAMKRKYTSFEVEKALSAIAQRWPDAFVGMDIIAGFPGETDEEFADTFQRMNSMPWTRMHVFPYSRRSGTFADRMDSHLPREVIKSRARRLRELSFDRHWGWAQKQVGKTKLGLSLSQPGRFLTEDYWSVKSSSAATALLRPGTEVKLKIDGTLNRRDTGRDPVLSATLLQ